MAHAELLPGFMALSLDPSSVCLVVSLLRALQHLALDRVLGTRSRDEQTQTSATATHA